MLDVTAEVCYIFVVTTPCMPVSRRVFCGIARTAKHTCTTRLVKAYHTILPFHNDDTKILSHSSAMTPYYPTPDSVEPVL